VTDIAELVQRAEEEKARAAEEARQETRSKVIGATCNTAEEEEIVEAFLSAGFKRNRDGSPAKAGAARMILLAFARSVKVRDAVAAFLRENPELFTD
jgi:hypothetical protein